MRLKATNRTRQHFGVLSPHPPTWTDHEKVESHCPDRCDHKHMNPWRLTGPRWAPLVLSSFLLSLLSTSCLAQYRPNWPSPYVQREIFVLNLEDGYFGCQVNESTDFLQLFELSKLCDGIPQCFQGSDEVSLELKCKDRSKFAHVSQSIYNSNWFVFLQTNAIPKCPSVPMESVWIICATAMTGLVEKAVIYQVSAI